METKFTVDWFIKKFKAIPDEMWSIHLTGQFPGQHCAIGHCHLPDENTALGITLFWQTLHIGVGTVIRKEHHKYQQPTPKQRILAALYDIKKLQAPQEIEYSIGRKLIEIPSKEEKINSAPDFHFKGIDFGSVEKVMTHDIKFSGKQVNIIQN